MKSLGYGIFNQFYATWKLLSREQNQSVPKKIPTMTPLVLLVLLLSQFLRLSAGHPFIPRGGAAARTREKVRVSISDDGPYHRLAKFIQARLEDEGEEKDLDKIEKTLKTLSSAQQTLKGLDGAAHEAYQRTHKSGGDVEDLTAVSGRAQRNAARLACTADALLSAELCELLELEGAVDNEKNNGLNGTLAHRQIILDQLEVKFTKSLNISVLVLWEPSYSGGVGLDHGQIRDLADGKKEKPKGRILVVVRDPLSDNFVRTLDILDVEPLQVELKAGLVANEIASVHPTIYRAAVRVVKTLEPLLRKPPYNETTIACHFVGRSLGGSVASLAAIILDGTLPIPDDRAVPPRKKKRKRNKKKQESSEEPTKKDDDSIDSTSSMTKNETEIVPLGDIGRGRSSAMVLGAPPCLSGNIKAAFVRSIIYGDDIISRATQESIDRLCQRTKRALKGGVLGRQMGWMTDTVSLTVSSLQSHARGSEGEEERLSVPGQVYLIRPRRLGGACSMHEVGGLKGGREALRAAVLWQLKDILLSKSLWKHHDLDSYIHGLDRVQVKGV